MRRNRRPSMTLLRMQHITKSFGANQVLHDVSLELEPGTVLGLVGENGAGKSTLMKILSGAYRPDSGTIEIAGQVTPLNDPAASIAAGIAVIYQELTMVPDLSVSENIFLGAMPRRGLLPLIDYGEAHRQAARILENLRLSLDPRMRVGSLAPGYQQMIEIGRAISRNARILVMDEPTSSLSEHEVTLLYQLVRRLKDLGLAIFGALPHQRGMINWLGRPLNNKRPDQAIAREMVLVPEDRKLEGLLLDASIESNMVLSVLRQISRAGWVDFKQKHALAREGISQFKVVARGPAMETRNLSGGNQQKVMFARASAIKPRLYLLDEPTRGIDVGAKVEVYHQIMRFAQEGCTILLVSSEIPELLGLCDRVLILNNGQIVGDLSRSEATAERVLHLSTSESLVGWSMGD